MNILVRAGHREEDILWKYSIEKVKRYFEDILDTDMNNKVSWANMIATCVYCFTPAETKTAASKKQAHWRKYISTIDPGEIKQKEKDSKNPLKMLAQLVPVFVPQPEEEESDDT